MLQTHDMMRIFLDIGFGEFNVILKYNLRCGTNECLFLTKKQLKRKARI